MDLKEGLKNIRDFPFPKEKFGQFPEETLDKMYTFAEKFGELIIKTTESYPSKKPEIFFEGAFNFVNNNLLSIKEREVALFVLASTWYSKCVDDLVLWLKKRKKEDKEKTFQYNLK